MAVTTAQGSAGGGGCKLSWSLEFDDVANTVTVDATHTTFSGDAVNDPQQAQITMQLNSGQPLVLNLLTGGTQFDGGAAKMLNTGPRTRTGVTLSLSTGRSKALTFSTQYQPPS